MLKIKYFWFCYGWDNSLWRSIAFFFSSTCNLLICFLFQVYQISLPGTNSSLFFLLFFQFMLGIFIYDCCLPPLQFTFHSINRLCGFNSTLSISRNSFGEKVRKKLVLREIKRKKNGFWSGVSKVKFKILIWCLKEMGSETETNITFV